MPLLHTMNTIKRPWEGMYKCMPGYRQPPEPTQLEMDYSRAGEVQLYTPQLWAQATASGQG